MPTWCHSASRHRTTVTGRIVRFGNIAGAAGTTITVKIFDNTCEPVLEGPVHVRLIVYGDHGCRFEAIPEAPHLHQLCVN
jgi:hypothetical protein